MGEGRKVYSAPVPNRAIGDQRLTGLHMKVLAAIAAHDRMSEPRGNGQGCWAGNKRLAEMIGCNYSNLSTALTHLATLGYIDRRVDPLNKRRRILFAVYTDRDKAVVKAAPNKDSLPTDKLSEVDQSSDSLPSGEDDAEIVCPNFGDYIPLKRGTYAAEAGQSYSDESAPRTELGTSALTGKTAKRLREIEAALKAVNGQPTQQQLDQLLLAQHDCWDVEDAHHGETLGWWAQRLASDIGATVEAAQCPGAIASLQAHGSGTGGRHSKES